MADWIEAARRVVANHGAEVLLPDGTWTGELPDIGSEAMEAMGHDLPVPEGILLDAQTAHMLVTVHDSLQKPENRAKFAAMPIERATIVGWQLIEKTKVES